MKIKINSYIPITQVEGPNSRFCIWVQGCSIRCKGCANSHMWDKTGGTEYDTEDIIELISSYKDKIEGITFLGGEPLDQLDAVVEISKRIQQIGLTVLVFTGYEYNKIKEQPKVQELVKYIDILIDGRFEKNNTDYSRAWVGSKNQNYYFLTTKYDEKIITEYKNKLELRINSNNEVAVNGMGDYSKIKSLLEIM